METVGTEKSGQVEGVSGGRIHEICDSVVERYMVDGAMMENPPGVSGLAMNFYPICSTNVYNMQ